MGQPLPFSTAHEGATPPTSPSRAFQAADAAPGERSGRPTARGPAAHLALAATLTLTLLLQGAFLLETKSFPDFVQPQPGLDINLQWQSARQLRRGGLHEPNVEAAMLSAPLPMLGLAVSQTILGERMVLHRILYLLLGAVAVGLVFDLGHRLTGGPLGGSTAALLLALQPTFVYSSSSPLKTTVDILLLAGGLLLVLQARQAPFAAGGALKASLAGLLLLGAAFNQWTLVGPLVFLVVFTALSRGSRPPGRLAVFLPLAAALLLIPLLRMGMAELSAPSGVRWCWPQFGVHMFIGVQPGATGVYHPIPGLQPSPRGHNLEARLAAEQQRGVPTSPSEADAFFRARSRATVVADPARAWHLFKRKLLLFFNAFEAKENFFVDELRERSTVIRHLPQTWGWLVVVAAAGAAALVCRRSWSHLALLLGLLAAALLATLAIFVTARYRFPAVIPLALLAGCAAAAVPELIRMFREGGGRGRRWAALTAASMLAAGALAGGLAFLPVISPEERAAILRRAQGNVRGSERAIRLEERLAALRANGREGAPPTHEEFRLLQTLARDSEAFTLARRLLRDDPGDMEAAGAVMEYLILLNRYDDARQLWQRLEREQLATREEFSPHLSPLTWRAFTRYIASR
ncbi:MAG: hypothetical protein HRF46_11205 [Acidobacteriota bacterium]